MTIRCTVKSGYDEDIVTDFMKVYHEDYSGIDHFQPFDFTLTTFWGEAAERAGLATPRRYIFFKDGNLVGLFQGLVRKIIFYKGLRAGSTSGNGLAVLSNVSMKELRLFLQKVLKQERCSSFSVFTPGSKGIQGFSKRANYTFYIQLDHSLDKIWRLMKKKTRNRVRKAEKLGVIVDFSISTESLVKAYRVISSTLEERQVSSPSRRWNAKLHECFQGQGCESVIASARIGDDDVVSAAHLIGFDNKLVLWQAGSTKKGYKANAGSLVQAKIIEWAKGHGYLIYDMGGTNPHVNVYAGIHRFKSGFGGDLFINTVLERSPFYVRALRSAHGLFGRIGLINYLSKSYGIHLNRAVITKSSHKR